MLWEKRSRNVVPPYQSHRTTKTLTSKPPSMLAEPKERTLNAPCLALFANNNTKSNAILLLLMDILIYSIFPRTWSFMILLLFGTQL